jgi:hypothetical protein
MKKIMLLLMLVPLAFAAGEWVGIASVTIVTSVALLAILYMVGHGFSINELEMTAKEELYQVIVAGLLVVLLVGSDNILDMISQNKDLTGGADTMQDAAIQSLGNDLSNLTLLLNAVASYDQSTTYEGSKTLQCSVMSIGYSVSGCGGYSMLTTPISMGGGILGFAAAEVSTMKRLIEISKNFALPFLLPLGILLRTFKITRGAGGLLIAVAISLHIIVPVGVIFNDMLGATFLADAAKSAGYDPAAAPAVVVGECSPGDVMTSPFSGASTGAGTVYSGISDWLAGACSGSNNEDRATCAYGTLRLGLRNYLYVILLKATIGPALALLMMAASIRALSALGGAEIDVSAISRFI